MLNTKHASPSAEQNWLVSHRDAFLDAMRKQHYATRTLQTYRQMTDRLCGWVRELGISCDGLDAVALNECALTCPLTGSKTMAREFAQVTGRFIDFLVKTGVIAERPAGVLSEPDFLAQLCMDFVQWLRHHRGMFGGRLRTHENMLSDFVAYCADGGSVAEALYALTPAKIHAYLAQVSGKVHWRVPYLRNILRFLFWRGLTACDLSGSIPSTRESKSGETVRHLDAETVGRLLAATRGESAREMRDYAMLLIMFRLGLRAQEVIALQLDDFDWRNGAVRIPRQRRAAGHHAVAGRCRRSTGQLDLQCEKRRLAPCVCVGLCAVQPNCLVIDARSCPSDCVQACRTEPAERRSAHPCVAAQPGDETAPTKPIT